MTKMRKIQTGVSFQPAIMDYIDELSRTGAPFYQRRSRSEIVNLIIEEHAQRNGCPLLSEQPALTAVNM
ncbi:MAG: hypothetical protein HY867_13540 [Chloroflexi bacterium]|nr:hypothetical protein [Chloroflexota bacterium]